MEYAAAEVVSSGAAALASFHNEDVAGSEL